MVRRSGVVLVSQRNLKGRRRADGGLVVRIVVRPGETQPSPASPPPSFRELREAMKPHIFTYFESWSDERGEIKARVARKMAATGYRFLLPLGYDGEGTERVASPEHTTTSEALEGTEYRVLRPEDPRAIMLIYDAFHRYYVAEPDPSDVVRSPEGVLSFCEDFADTVDRHAEAFADSGGDDDAVARRLASDALRSGHRFLQRLRPREDGVQSYCVLDWDSHEDEVLAVARAALENDASDRLGLGLGRDPVEFGNERIQRDGDGSRGVSSGATATDPSWKPIPHDAADEMATNGERRSAASRDVGDDDESASAPARERDPDSLRQGVGRSAEELPRGFDLTARDPTLRLSEGTDGHHKVRHDHPPPPSRGGGGVNRLPCALPPGPPSPGPVVRTSPLVAGGDPPPTARRRLPPGVETTGVNRGNAAGEQRAAADHRHRVAAATDEESLAEISRDRREPHFPVGDKNKGNSIRSFHYEGEYYVEHWLHIRTRRWRLREASSSVNAARSSGKATGKERLDDGGRAAAAFSTTALPPSASAFSRHLRDGGSAGRPPTEQASTTAPVKPKTDPPAAVRDRRPRPSDRHPAPFRGAERREPPPSRGGISARTEEPTAAMAPPPPGEASPSAAARGRPAAPTDEKHPVDAAAASAIRERGSGPGARGTATPSSVAQWLSPLRALSSREDPGSAIRALRDDDDADGACRDETTTTTGEGQGATSDPSEGVGEDADARTGDGGGGPTCLGSPLVTSSSASGRKRNRPSPTPPPARSVRDAPRPRSLKREETSDEDASPHDEDRGRSERASCASCPGGASTKTQKTSFAPEGSGRGTLSAGAGVSRAAPRAKLENASTDRRPSRVVAPRRRRRPETGTEEATNSTEAGEPRGVGCGRHKNEDTNERHVPTGSQTRRQSPEGPSPHIGHKRKGNRGNKWGDGAEILRGASSVQNRDDPGCPNEEGADKMRSENAMRISKEIQAIGGTSPVHRDQRGRPEVTVNCDGREQLTAPDAPLWKLKINFECLTCFLFTGEPESPSADEQQLTSNQERGLTDFVTSRLRAEDVKRTVKENLEGYFGSSADGNLARITIEKVANRIIENWIPQSLSDRIDGRESGGAPGGSRSARRKYVARVSRETSLQLERLIRTAFCGYRVEERDAENDIVLGNGFRDVSRLVKGFGRTDESPPNAADAIAQDAIRLRGRRFLKRIPQSGSYFVLDAEVHYDEIKSHIRRSISNKLYYENVVRHRRGRRRQANNNWPTSKAATCNFKAVSEPSRSAASTGHHSPPSARKNAAIAFALGASREESGFDETEGERQRSSRCPSAKRRKTENDAEDLLAGSRPGRGKHKWEAATRKSKKIRGAERTERARKQRKRTTVDYRDRDPEEDELEKKVRSLKCGDLIEIEWDYHKRYYTATVVQDGCDSMGMVWVQYDVDGMKERINAFKRHWRFRRTADI